MSEESFIEPGILENLGCKTLFYPAAGVDWDEFLDCLEDRVDEFRFSDIKYDFSGKKPSPFSNRDHHRLVSSELYGQSVASIETCTSRCGSYRHVESGQLTEIFERIRDQKRTVVIRRRGFGQYALNEIADGALGIFVHRGDSPGEGGSNIWFLSHWKCKYPPVGSLFATVCRKLADRSLVISDGSNTDFGFLKKFHRRGMAGLEAYSESRKTPHMLGGFEWNCVGYMQPRYGPTLVWSLVRV